MAVEACANANMFDDDDDDDGPVVFKRRDSSSKANLLSSEAKGSSASRPDKGQVKPVSGTHTSNDRTSSAPKGKVVQSVKASTSKPSGEIKRPAVPSSNAPPVRSPPFSIASSHPGQVKKDSNVKKVESSTHGADDDRSISVRSSSPLGTKLAKEGPNMNSIPSKVKVEAGKSANIASLRCDQPRDDFKLRKVEPSHSDSDDDVPLSVRLSGALSSPNLVNKGPSTYSVPSKVMAEAANSSDISDDEKPLCTKFQLKQNGGLSSSKVHDSDDDKPLSFKLQQNGSVKREIQTTKTLMSPKRPIGEAGSCQASSTKKLKLSNASAPAEAKRAAPKMESEDESDQDYDSQRVKKDTSNNRSVTSKSKNSKVVSSSVKVKKDQKIIKKVPKKSNYSKSSKLPPSSGDGQKWRTLSHNGVLFPPPYKPHGVKMLYDGKPVNLTPEQEEVATMYAVMLETDYVQKPKFNENFFNDWKKILGKNHVIQDLKKCDFTPIHQWHLVEKEKKKQMSSEEKKALKDEKLKQEEKYMWAILDGVKEKVGNFRVEPPGLFRGRGEHPKMGKLKKRIHPSDIVINIGKGAPVPECPIPGGRWKEVRHDNTVTWLAYWNDPINQKEFKYIFLAASSTLKGQSDKEKYEKARKLKDYIQDIRATYTKNFTSKDVTTRQIAVATYLIDRLALRAGNEKDDDEADTVGCCTLKVENVKPIHPNILEFDFLGKDSIKYYKQFEADPLVFKAVTQFRQGKEGSDDLFDKLDTSKLNAHLKDIMPGLTAKVFRTYNASFTLDDMLSRVTSEKDLAQKVTVYNQANKEVAIICNHQRSVSKNHASSMEKLNGKINDLKDTLSELERDLARAKKGKYPDSNGKRKRNLAPEALEKKVSQTKAKIEKMVREMESKEDMKQIALGTSKLNYCDPRITVAWCKRNEVPIEKVFAKTMQAKFAWAMDVDPSFRF
ncbi:hypothetical protein Dimus_000142 [Dionaea muscipula]